MSLLIIYDSYIMSTIHCIVNLRWGGMSLIRILHKFKILNLGYSNNILNKYHL